MFAFQDSQGYIPYLKNQINNNNKMFIKKKIIWTVSQYISLVLEGKTKIPYQLVTLMFKN